MSEYEIIRFETNPIALRNKDESFYPNSKYWNQLYNISKTYLLSKHYFPEGHSKNDMFIDQMNVPQILKKCRLRSMPIALEENKRIKTAYIRPAGDINGRNVIPKYIMVSAKYVLLDAQKTENVETLKIVEYNRLNTLKNGRRVKIYSVQIYNSRQKVVLAE